MAITLEDVLARRTRALLLDAKATVESAATVADLMANEMSKNNEWIDLQVASFRKTASNYML
ncbi:hypothetical protein D3C86_1854020 [compost metagenome]